MLNKFFRVIRYYILMVVWWKWIRGCPTGMFADRMVCCRCDDTAEMHFGFSSIKTCIRFKE